jgi:uncharacterized protein YyaL (SSP411 family)
VTKTALAGVWLALLVGGGGGGACKKKGEPPQGDAGIGLLGAQPRSDELEKRLAARLADLGPDYVPRTRHQKPDGSPQFINRLMLEPSPYLRQHAHNPVDWYAWGEEAFAAARRLGRPIFVSIGYSTCHWCHVMEEESFEDLEVARYLNENYIAIKVDREERPDIDSLYMMAVQAMGGSGGWPLNVWLTPELKPFFGGTYFPPRDRPGGQIGLLTLLTRLRDLYRDQPERVAEQAALVLRAVRGQEMAAAADLPGPDLIATAVRYFEQHFDPTYGGVRSQRQKFPSDLPVRLLLRYHRRSGDQRALDMATFSLERMAVGGLRDHIGGGFHRYSTDPRWLVPHFEKMLYDNALLATAYLEAFQASGRPDFSALCQEILAYVAGEMTSPEGGFYSASDADSIAPGGKRIEGYYFTWTPEQVKAVLDEEGARVALAYYDISAGGNFQSRSIPNTPRPLASVAAELGLPVERARTALASARVKLRKARSRRPAPLRDVKILTAWNGLMISAYARAALILGRDEEENLDYLAVAARAARLLLEHARSGERLLHSYQEGSGRGNAFLEDYAFFIAALLDLFEASGEVEWLERAIALDRVLEQHYEDRERGGFYRTSDDQEQLLAREKPAEDGALPSGNSVAALNLLRLHELTTRESYLERADRLLRAFAGNLAARPFTLEWMLIALDFRSDVAREIVLVYPKRRADLEPFLEVVRDHFGPNQVLVQAATAAGPARVRLEKQVPLLSNKVARGARATAYVCEKRRCQLPTSDPRQLATQLDKVARYPAARAPDRP